VFTWLVTAALAAPLTDYPYRADVELPEEGIVLIDVPLELRAPVDVRDGSDLKLVDAVGNEVDFAVIDGRPSRTEVAGRRASSSAGRALSWAPSPEGSGDLYDVWIAQRPLDGLSVDLRDVPAYADIRVDRQQEDGSYVEVARRRVFRILRRDHTDIPGPFEPGTYRLHIDHVRAPTAIDGYRLSQPALPDATVELDLGPPEIQENGVTVYDVTLPRPLAGTHLTLLPEEDLFERDVRIHTDVTQDRFPDTLTPPLEALPRDKVIGRVMLGSTSLSDTTVPLPTSEEVRQYRVAVQGTPLTIPKAVLSADGFAIVARNPGPGPHRLYGGAVHGLPSRDMAAGLDALVRNLDGRVATAEVEPNPQFLPPPIPGSAPGAPLALDGLSWGRTIDAEGAGLVRIPLDDHVLLNARPDLGDLRLVADDGRQVPYALRRHPEPGHAEGLSFERAEKGRESVVEVTLPEANLPVRTLTLHTEDGRLFDRRVTLWRQTGKRRDVIRVLRWVSSSHPSSLSIAVQRRVGEELVVTIDNGDDPPLAIDRVDVQWDRWELVAHLPDTPVELLYGDEDRWAPSYDATPALRRATELGAATLQDPRSRGREAPPLERAATIAGMGCVGVGVVVMLIMLVTMAPKDDEEPVADEDEHDRTDEPDAAKPPEDPPAPEPVAAAEGESDTAPEPDEDPPA